MELLIHVRRAGQNATNRVNYPPNNTSALHAGRRGVKGNQSVEADATDKHSCKSIPLSFHLVAQIQFFKSNELMRCSISFDLRSRVEGKKG